MAIRDMVKVFPSLSSESVLWLDSLSQADPLHVLPFVWSGLLLISFEVSIYIVLLYVVINNLSSSASDPQRGTWQNFAICLLVHSRCVSPCHSILMERTCSKYRAYI